MTMPEVIHKVPVAGEGCRSRERRRADRIQTNQPAYLKCRLPLGDADVPPVPCVIRDASMTGAMLSLDHGAAIAEHAPLGGEFERLTLQIPSIGVEVCCAVVWRKNGQLGVRYMSPPRLLSDAAREACCVSGTHELPRDLVSDLDLRALNQTSRH